VGLKKAYFLSDAHLGMFPTEKSLDREKLLVTWMDEIRTDASEIYFLGDIFDFWYEYNKVVPKGFTRFLGKLAELTDSGIPVYFFIGNHDVWNFGYLASECGVEIIKGPITKTIMGKKFHLAHGDGLGPGDTGYSMLKWAFHNKILQWLFSRLHPNFALSLGQKWSKNSRLAKGVYVEYKGEKEYLLQYSKQLLTKEFFDFMVYGHRHVPMQIKLNEKTEFICLGDWIVHFTYAVFDGEKLVVQPYLNKDKIRIITH
jgi:UDP-2,3-diacylglucosamine hydrolase